MILALKTAGPTTEFYLLSAEGHTTTSLTWDSGRTLADQLLARLTTFLADHHTPLENLTGLIIFSGPGSFTSLRIGHTTLNALADSIGLPIAGATGDHWLTTGFSSLRAATPGQPALPHYGAEAHITHPKP